MGILTKSCKPDQNSSRFPLHLCVGAFYHRFMRRKSLKFRARFQDHPWIPALPDNPSRENPLGQYRLDVAEPWLNDPCLILRARGIEPDPWQVNLLRSTTDRLLLNCSRQVGKTTTIGTLALHQAMIVPNRPVVLLAPCLRQSRELFQQVLAGHEAIDNSIDIKSCTKDRIDFGNGSRVLALPGREATIRGIGGVSLLVIDEAARVEDSLYKSVRPMIAASNGKIISLSTPYGRRGWFHAEWTGPHPWTRISVPWTQCPRIRPEFIAEETQSLGERWVRQEYGCEFLSGSGLVYPDYEKALFSEPIDKSKSRPPGNVLAGKLVGGIDFGWRNPFAAIWGHLGTDGHLRIFGERVLAQTPLCDHSKALPRNAAWWADPAGRTEIEELRRAGHAVRPGINALDAGIALVTSRIRTGRLSVVASTCPELVREFSLYRWPDEFAPGQSSRRIAVAPIDADNHALAALRYLIMGIDRRAHHSSSPTFAGVPDSENTHNVADPNGPSGPNRTSHKSGPSDLWTSPDHWTILE